MSQSRNAQFPGSQAPGSQTPGPQAPGPQVLGSQVPGSQFAGSQIPGSQVRGSQVRGPQIPGSQILGPQIPGSQILGSQILGSQIPGPHLLSPFQPGLAHRLWRWLPAAERRHLLARVTARLAPRPSAPRDWPHPARTDPAAPVRGIAIGGELSRPSGLGEAARLMIRGARAMGVPVWALDIPPPTAWDRIRPDPGAYPPPHIPLILHVNAPVLPLALLRLPRALTRDRRIIACWAWELPEVTPEWREAAPLVHEIWVPSRFTAAAIEPLKPHHVHVVPPPLGLVPPLPSDLSRAAFGLPEDAVVVLVSFNLASSFARKNPLGAIDAFRLAFGERTDRILVVKVCHAAHAPDDFARIAKAARAPNIRLIQGEMSGPDRHALTAASDIVLSLHRAEGFGLVPAEAMLLGKPVIATGWSGNTDFMDATNAELVDYRLIPAMDDRGVYRDSYWADPDIPDAAMRLRRLADDPAGRRRLGLHARQTTAMTLNGAGLMVALRALGLTLPEAQPTAPRAGAGWTKRPLAEPDELGRECVGGVGVARLEAE